MTVIRESLDDFILKSHDESSQSNGHGDFTVKPPDYGRLTVVRLINIIQIEMFNDNGGMNNYIAILHV